MVGFLEILVYNLKQGQRKRKFNGGFILSVPYIQAPTIF